MKLCFALNSIRQICILCTVQLGFCVGYGFLYFKFKLHMHITAYIFYMHDL
jgi:hypothetical protein